MNKLTSIKQRKTHFGIIISIILVLAILGVTVWFLRKQILPNPHAAASTTLSFSPASPTINSDGTFSSDIMADPGTNQVSLIKLVLGYDNSQIALDPSGITVNTAAFPTTLDGPTNSCNGTACTMTMTLSIGSDPTKAITTATKVATVKAKLLGSSQTSATITFTQDTQVLSIAAADQASENVLSSTTPLTVNGTGGGTPNPSNGQPSPTNDPNATPTPFGEEPPPTSTPTPSPIPACVATPATCAWDNLPTATGYHYKVTDITKGVTVAEGDLTPPQSSITFQHTSGDTYTCTVTASNACKTDQAAVTTNTCGLPPSPTPTPTPLITSTPGPSPTPIPTSPPGPSLASCNQSCTMDSNCTNGLACVGGFCRNPSCTSSSTCTCPTTPTPTSIPPVYQPTQPPQYIAQAPTDTPTSIPPKILPTGPGDIFIQIGAVGIALVVVGGLLVIGL